ncbi:hypothetical protein ISN45_Aa05g024720 [Arabidopsis thaliana x Arabidopsis arenosa]|uniref:Uncharacterized protein n=1 Tax=Arabidopsis thaliana x Arabidopsis arenosa TaxID=1240361 RepID=A0A8T1ZS88_9BRAS|nr:hypothetical protein ISN45_Aa05g024720 [Arabidopsis thaliana x Arabidopsis arenosa]
MVVISDAAKLNFVGLGLHSLHHPPSEEALASSDYDRRFLNHI